MKLRKVGNSLGATFSRVDLTKAGFSEGQELEVVAVPGELVIRPAVMRGFLVEFTPAEARALAEGRMDTKPGASALAKVRYVVEAG